MRQTNLTFGTERAAVSLGSIAVSFINVSETEKGEYSVNVTQLVNMLGRKMINRESFAHAKEYRVVDLWTGETSVNVTGSFGVHTLQACDNVTIRITPVVQ